MESQPISVSGCLKMCIMFRIILTGSPTSGPWTGNCLWLGNCAAQAPGKQAKLHLHMCRIKVVCVKPSTPHPHPSATAVDPWSQKGWGPLLQKGLPIHHWIIILRKSRNCSPNPSKFQQVRENSPSTRHATINCCMANLGNQKHWFIQGVVLIHTIWQVPAYL